MSVSSAELSIKSKNLFPMDTTFLLERALNNLEDAGYDDSNPAILTLKADLERAKAEKNRELQAAAERKDKILQLLTEAEEEGLTIVKEYLKTIGYGTRRLPARLPVQSPCTDFPAVCSNCETPFTYQVGPDGEKIVNHHLPAGIRRCQIETPTGMGLAFTIPIPGGIQMVAAPPTFN